MAMVVRSAPKGMLMAKAELRGRSLVEPPMHHDQFAITDPCLPSKKAANPTSRSLAARRGAMSHTLPIIDGFGPNFSDDGGALMDRCLATRIYLSCATKTQHRAAKLATMPTSGLRIMRTWRRSCSLTEQASYGRAGGTTSAQQNGAKYRSSSAHRKCLRLRFS
jgi:hypothetical protein